MRAGDDHSGLCDAGAGGEGSRVRSCGNGAGAGAQLRGVAWGVEHHV